MREGSSRISARQVRYGKPSWTHKYRILNIENWMKMSKEDHGFHQDFITEFEKSIPVPSTPKYAFFPETEPEKKPKPGVTYSTLSDRMKSYHTPGARRG